MPTVASIEALVAAKIQSGSGDGLGLTRCADDYRNDLQNVADGSTLFQLRVVQTGRAGGSNSPTLIAAFGVSLIHKLGTSEDERDWTLGTLLTHLDKLTRETWWCDPSTGIAGIRDFLSDPTSIGVATERTARVLETTIGPIRVGINS